MHAGSVPAAAMAPLLVGGFVLTYIGDMAYGDKLIRVRLEAEHILENERELLIPSKSMPARKNWDAEVLKLESRPGGSPGRVSDKWFSVIKR